MAWAASRSGWRHFRAQRLPIQALVWIFALPVPVLLWALQRHHDRGPAIAFAIVVTVACLGVPVAAGRSPRPPQVIATGSDTQVATTPRSDPSVVAAPPTAADRSTSTASTTTSSEPPSTQAPGSGPAEMLGALRVQPEVEATGYDRDLFNHWGDADGDGCDTRCEVLAAERSPILPGLPGGGWRSLYDGDTTDDPSELDIDHLVPLAEAWRSGASAWEPARRAAFANDLDDPRTLIAVTAASNRSRSDSDPSGWRPPDRSYWCQYVTDWMAVKLRWDLAVDPIEFTPHRHLVADDCGERG